MARGRRKRDGQPAGLKFDEKRAERILGFVRGGSTHEAAARAAGIHPATMYRWLERGQRAGAPHNDRYKVFADAFEQADAEFEVVHVGLMSRAARGGDVIEERTVTRKDGSTVRIVRRAAPDWRAGQALLRARRPQDWGDRQAIEISGPGGGPIEMDVDASRQRVGTMLDRLRQVRDQPDTR